MAINISAPFIRAPIATSLLMVAVLFVGLVAYPNLPVAPLPQVDFPTLQVSATLPGASPETMASVRRAAAGDPVRADPRRLADDLGLDARDRPRSPCSSISTATSTARRATCWKRSTPPAASCRRTCRARRPSERSIPPTRPILLLAASSNALPLTEVNDQVQTKLVQQISQIPGVAQVLIGGQQTPSIRIQLDPAKLVAKNLSLEEVRPALTAATTDDPKGTIYSGARAFTIYANDQITRAEKWNDVIVAYRNDGALRVRDIGRAVAGPQDTTQAGWADGKRAVFLVIFKQPGANVIDTVDKILAELPRIKASMPPSIDVAVLSDRTQTIRAAVDDVRDTLLLTIALVVAVIFVFLRSVWATLIPSVTVPLALLGAFALMWVGRLHARQPFADGADDLGRLRRRRRHRDARKHHALHRGGHVAARGGAEGLRRNRLHHSLDQHFAGRGADPAVADERHHRPPVPRILDHAVDDDPGVRHRLADADADDGVALPQAARERQARAALQLQRARLRRPAERLRARARCRAGASLHHAAGVPRHGRR